MHVYRYNPWWLKEPDPIVQEWKESEIRWIPREIEELSLTPFSLNVLWGPRQVGKTTLVKLLIDKMIKSGRDPLSIFYFSCDELSSYKELGEVIDNYLRMKRERGIENSYIFLDEVTFVEDWWRAIKSRVDRREVIKDVITVTGSASIDLLASKERFPGRRGNGRDVALRPLSFGDSLEIIFKYDLERGEIEDIDHAMKANYHLRDLLMEHFLRYMKTGGFPIPFKEYHERGSISYRSEKAMIDWLISDWIKIGKNPSYMKEVLSYILHARLSPISWLDIAKETSISSPHTTRSYVEALEGLMISKVSYLITPQGDVKYRKNKKIHLTDPFIYRIISSYTGVEVLDETLVESLVAMHLARLGDIYYWRDGTEVDVILRRKGKLMGFEVKWGPKRWKSPKWLQARLLKREDIPLFLASLSMAHA